MHRAQDLLKDVVSRHNANDGVIDRVEVLERLSMVANDLVYLFPSNDPS